MPFRSLAMMYTNGIGKRQRHWTPAFAGVTLFEVIALKMLGLTIVDLFDLIIVDPFDLIIVGLFGLIIADLFDRIVSDLFGLITLLICLKSISPFERMTLLFERTTLKLSSRRRPGSSVFRISPVNA